MLRDARVTNFQKPLNDQSLDGPTAEMQLFSESAPRIAFLVNSAALTKHRETVAHRALCPMQYLTNRLGKLVSRKVEQDPIIIWGPWTPIPLSASFGASPR